MKSVIRSAALALLAACLCRPEAALGATRCEVVERSVSGGTVEVVTDERLPDWFTAVAGSGPQIVWHPPPAPQSPDLVIAYRAATLANMGYEPSGGHVRFYVSKPRRSDNTQVIITFPDGQTSIRQGKGLGYGSDDADQPVMDVVFGPQDRFGNGGTDWPTIRATIIERGHLGIRLVRSGKTIAEEVFDFSDTDARDALLAQARRKVEAVDPEVCHDAPVPVVRVF